MKIKAVFFDLDDTLVLSKPLYKQALPNCTKVFNEATGLDVSLEEFEKMYMVARDEVHSLVPSGAASHNRAIYFQRMLEALDIQTNIELVYELYKTFYDYVYANMELFPHAIELLKWVKESGRQIVIVSDGNSHVRIHKIHAIEIGKYIDYLVSSEEVGMDKPSSQGFLLALNKVNLKTDEVIMVGNKAPSDIYGAERLDMITVMTTMTHFESDQPTKPMHDADYTVSDLIEVKGIIEKIEAS